MRHTFPLLNESSEIDSFDLLAFLTGFCLLFLSYEMRYLSALTLLVILFSRTLRRSPWLWLATAASFWPHLILHWETHEDHSYLINYWCLAIGLSRLGKHSFSTIKTNARLLIGLTFAIGCFWKITSADFMDGSLHTYNMLYDTRFAAVFATPFGLIPDSAANVAALEAVRTSAGASLNTAQVAFEPGLVWVAHAMTWWTVAIEAVIACFFLWPTMSLSKQFRDLSLMVFTATTYFLVPVLGFGCLLCAMGAAQCEAKQRWTRMSYAVLSLTIAVCGVW